MAGREVRLCVSLDGVMVPMKDGEHAEKRACAAARGQHLRGPAGHQEAGCATLSYYDKNTNRLCTRRMARMSQGNKHTLKELLTAEVTAALAARADLRFDRAWHLLSRTYQREVKLPHQGYCIERLEIMVITSI